MAEAEVLRRGGVILYPTDTIWGIGCDATDPDAVRRVYEIKRRSDSKSLVLLASDLDMVARYITKIPDVAIDLVEVNDKPMTIIYPGAVCSQAPAEGEATPKDRWHLAWNTVAEDGSVGIRIPMMDFCKELVRRLGRPLDFRRAFAESLCRYSGGDPHCRGLCGGAFPGKGIDRPGLADHQAGGRRRGDYHSSLGHGTVLLKGNRRLHLPSGC